MIFARGFRGAALLAAALSFWCAPAAAAPVAVTWSAAANATLHSRSEAMAKGFQEAVTAEALGLLPAALAPERAALLAAWLAPRAGQYVQSYSELSTTVAAEETTLALDVRVDRPALRRVLQSLGVYYTAAAPRPFGLVLSGEAAAHRAEISRLEALSGLYAAEGASPQLTLAAAGKAWTGRLASPAGETESAGESLDAVWLDLWGRHFSSPEAQAGVLDRLVLRVDGWFAPDGIRDFDAELRAFEGVESAVLDRVILTPTGASAVWRVRTPNPGSLRTRMEGYIPGRGLTYALDAPAQEAPDQPGHPEPALPQGQ
ncbi:MAG: hypothetical protein AB1916_06305 [Thermodesulfobacteriota bacterium]